MTFIIFIILQDAFQNNTTYEYELLKISVNECGKVLLYLWIIVDKDLYLLPSISKSTSYK